jgi:hypothetical protein
MSSENQLEDSSKLTQRIDHYLDIEDIPEEELYIDMQLELDEENDEYVLDYGVTAIEGGADTDMVWTFKYGEIGEAWENYLDQLPELYQNYPEAVIKTPRPESYEAPKGGGNPAR